MKKDKIRLMDELKLEKPKKIKVSNLVKIGVGIAGISLGIHLLHDL